MMQVILPEFVAYPQLLHARDSVWLHDSVKCFWKNATVLPQASQAGQAHLKLEWVFLYGDRVICTQNPFVPRGGTLWVCSQRHRFRTILPR